MNFQGAVRTCLQKYVTFEGRAARSEFWWFVLFVILGNIILSIVDGIIGTGGPSGGILSGLFGLGMLLPNIAVSVRRLHDLGKTGWWYLLVLIPIIGWIILIIFYVQKGTDGPNDYGPDPLAGAA